MALPFLDRYYESIQEDGVRHRAKWMSVGNDRAVRMVSLYSIYPYVAWVSVKVD